MSPDVTLPRTTPPELSAKFQQACALARHPSQRHLAPALAMLLECVGADPGNLLFVETFLQIVPRTATRRRRWRALWHRLQLAWAQYLGNWLRVARQGTRLLAADPASHAALCALGHAMQQLDCHDVALRYWFAAEAAHPEKVDVQRNCAQAFARQGLFRQAIVCWQRVAQLAPHDTHAIGMLAKLRSSKTGPAEPKGSLPTSGPSPLVQAASQRPVDALDVRQQLVEALRVAPGDLQLIEQLEDLDLQAARDRLDVARQQDPAHNAPLVEDLRADLARHEIAVYGARATRYPLEHRWKLKLAAALQQMGSFGEACRTLSDIPPAAECQVERHLLWGECLQYQRQFEQALAHYELAVDQMSSGQPLGDPHLLALYRAGVLALQMGDTERAATRLARLESSCPDYKDTRRHLDKIASIRDKDGFSR